MKAASIGLVLHVVLGCSDKGASQPNAECGQPMQCFDKAMQSIERARVALEHAKESFLPIGTILSVGFDPGSEPPAGWLVCDGSEHKIEKHRLLHQVLKNTSFPIAAEQVGYFRVPDLRGFFLRGNDPTGVRNGDNAGRRVGSEQGSAVGEHSHKVRLPFEKGPNGGTNEAAFEKWDVHNVVPLEANARAEGEGIRTETRPSNIAVVFLIRG